MTVGEKLVGLTFNPNANPDVEALKKIFASAIDYLGGKATDDNRGLIDEAIMQIVTAQMWSVKAVTWTE